MKVTGIIPFALLSVVWIAHAVDLANSGYPINRANPQRNNHINRPILCSSISKGRTTVLNLDKALGDENTFFPFWISPVLDDQNNLYVTAKLEQYSLRKIDLSTLTVSGTSTSIDQGLITVGTTNLYASSATTTAVIQRSNLASLFETANTGGDGYASLVPYLSDLMIRAQVALPPSTTQQSFAFFNVSSGSFQSTPLAPAIGAPRDPMVYKTNTVEYPILVGEKLDQTDTFFIMISAGEGRFFKNISSINMHTNDPFIVDNILYIFTTQNTIHHVSVVDGTTTKVLSWNIFGQSNLNKNAMVKGGKILASLEVTDNEKFVIAELTGNVTVRSDEQFAGNPVLSLVDNVVLMSILEDNGNVKLLGLDWDNWGVKVIANLGVLGNPVTSEPVIGENCSVHIIADGALYTLKPLPLQRVVPVIECIEDNMAYFSYNSLETKGFNIPFVADRNNLFPMETTPITSFKVGSGDHYPLAPSIALVGNPTSYKWVLEEYVLEFTNTPALRCPANVSLFLIFNANAAFNVPVFGNIVRDAFVNVTGIRDTRVTLGNATTMARSARAVQQGDFSLEVELQIQSGNQTEPSTSQIVTEFVNNQQNQFNEQITNDPNSPDRAGLLDAKTKQPETAQSGVLVQQPAPTSQQPTTSQPVAVPTAIQSSAGRSSLAAVTLLGSLLVLLV